MSDNLLFLSHSSHDTDAACLLKKKIEESSFAQEHNIKVWLDKHDLIAGKPWQNQLEEVIEKKSTAFAVYIGYKGVANWVEPEVRLALSRTIKENGSYPFVPIISKNAQGSSSLPGFIKQFQGIRDPENDTNQLKELLNAIVGIKEPKTAIVKMPFVGLRAFTKHDSHLFYGRESESSQLLHMLRHNRLVVVFGDSGSGKSSLVKAGVIPLYLHGRLHDELSEERNYSIDWKVIECQPKTAPFKRLAEVVINEGKRLNFSLADATTISSTFDSCSRNISDVATILKFPFVNNDRLLIVIDQFEEML